jgi:acyl-CoA synthetase (NDP forming)
MPDSPATVSVKQTPAATVSGHPLDYIFRPRSVAIAGVSRAKPGFGGVSLGFLIACKEMGCDNLYAVNPKYDDVEGVKCYPSLLDIEGPVDHVISSVPATVVPTLVEDAIAKGVKVIHFFTAGFRETGEEEMAEMEATVVARCREAGIRVLGPNCMGLYVPGQGLSFMPGFLNERGPVGYISQSGGNAGDMVFTSTVRGIRYSKVVSYGNAADVDESELLDYLAEDLETEVICAYIEGVKDGRRFFQAMKKAAAAKPVIVLKGGRTEAGTRAVMSHTASLAGSFEVFDALCRQVNAVRVNGVEDMVDLAVAFRFGAVPKGPGVAVVGGGGGFSVFAADEIDDAGLQCPVLPEHTQAELREFTPVAGTSVRNPVDTIALFQPPLLRRTLQTIGEAENIDVVMFHTSFNWGNARRTMAMAQDIDPAAYMDNMIQQMTEARDACGTPILVVLRPALDASSMEAVATFQEKCWRAGFPVFPTIPKAAASIAATYRWRQARESS